ncbi:MAG: R3H domain-containing nucleic acid-binding protein [bacterium]|jgi:spoIIIJ-associated protein
MQSVVSTGRNLEEAKLNALEELGINDVTQVEFEELESPVDGIIRLRCTLKSDNTSGQITPQAADSGHSDEDLGDEPTPDVVEKAMLIAKEVAEYSRLSISPTHHGNQGRYIHIEYSGADCPLLIQHHGEFLDSLQYLMNVILSKFGGGGRVILDSLTYRKKRADRLRELATSLAEQVKDRQEEAELDPLPAHERRIIHHALLQDDGVQTYSEGNEPNRYVVISPKR